MALDHYVSQVYLQNFYSPLLNQLMYATRKSDLKSYPCNSESVCRIEENSTNPYLTESRIIEDFLFSVEPKFNAAVAKFKDNQIDQESILAIAGFIAYIGTCSPAAIRIHAGPMKEMLKASAILVDSMGQIPPAPVQLGSKTLSELIASNQVVFTVDPKYPQAIGTTNIVGRTSIFGNSRWELLKNTTGDNPFFTSDYPIALERLPRRLSVNWIVPLTPDFAVRIIPDTSLARTPPDFSFRKFSFDSRALSRSDVIKINRLIVQCAEDTVFYRDDLPWIKDFVAKYKDYRIDTMIEEIQGSDGIIQNSRQAIVKRLE